MNRIFRSTGEIIKDNNKCLESNDFAKTKVTNVIDIIYKSKSNLINSETIGERNDSSPVKVEIFKSEKTINDLVPVIAKINVCDNNTDVLPVNYYVFLDISFSMDSFSNCTNNSVNCTKLLICKKNAD
jgi:hypothetical protein